MKKEYEAYLLYGLLALIIFALIFTFYGFPKTGVTARGASANNKIAEGVTNSENALAPVGSGSTEQGDVSIELAPYPVSNAQLKVKIAANTHSVDLSQFDLKQITSLEYEGKSVKPVSAPTLNGHHSTGELVFEVEKPLNSFTIKIKGIPKVADRVFTWQI